MQCVVLAWNVLPASAQTGHLSGVRVVNDEIKKNGREVHVEFILDIEEMHVKRQEKRASLSGGGGERGWEESGASFCGVGRSCPR